MDEQDKLEVWVHREFKLIIEEASPKTQTSENQHEVKAVALARTKIFVPEKNTMSKMLRDILVAIRAWFQKFGGLARSEIVFDEEKQGLLKGG
ncbi:hypothetical protein FLAG1_12007 [Fusarium langsethiae]|uniref:Uncharacterized protein n=1 Tax=Fusarium langsethiae TaxID=179993 RepID=A0A0N0DAG4_FUSLA|nr:hypothetical protein FLAG1_12007 [Fusarium langsethiae]